MQESLAFIHGGFLVFLAHGRSILALLAIAQGAGDSNWTMRQASKPQRDAQLLRSAHMEYSGRAFACL